MARRPAGRGRLLGLWTAGWLFVLLLIGLARVGTWRLQWWVLLVPVLWAAVALVRGRAGHRHPHAGGRRAAVRERRSHGWGD